MTKKSPVGVVIKNIEAPAELIKRLRKNSVSALRLGTLRCAQHLEGEVRRTIRSVFKPGTGNLSRSFKTVFLVDTEDEVSIGVLSDLVYARVQNEGSKYLPGGVIRSSRGPNKMLAIPMEGRGIPLGKWPRDFAKGELHFGIAKGIGSVLLNSSDQIMFKLRRKVKIKGKQYLKKALTKSKPEWPRVLNERLEELIEEAANAANKKGG